MIGVKWDRVVRQESKVIIVCSGPSLKGFDFNRLKHNNRYIIAVNGAGDFIPFADAWFTLDPWGLGSGEQLPKDFTGELWAAVPEDFSTPDAHYWEHRLIPPKPIHYLHRIPFSSLLPYSTSTIGCKDEWETWGLNEDTTCINTGNSGFGALGMAYHMNPQKILLLGVDASTKYFYATERVPKNLTMMPALFNSALAQLHNKNIVVINGSLKSNVEAFPKFNIDEALERF